MYSSSEWRYTIGAVMCQSCLKIVDSVMSDLGVPADVKSQVMLGLKLSSIDKHGNVLTVF
jgi:glutamyl-tRNA reductase